MAWSPFQRANAGIIWVERPGDYANPIPTTSATGPLATTSADFETGVAGKAAFFSSLSSFAAISANLEEEFLVDALAELIQTCSALVLDLVEPDRQLCEPGVEVAHRGPLLLARALARDRR